MTQQTATPLKQFNVPFFRPSIGDEEIAAVVETLKSGWLTTGPRVRAFEKAFAEYVGARFAVAVGSCTAALHLALEAVGVGPGDEVIVPTMTFASTAEVVLHLGARPVLADCVPGTLTVDPRDIEAGITGRTRAIVPVHYGGHPCELSAIEEIAHSCGAVIIEDAAHALPARYGDRMVGTFGAASCFSFYANKTITTGEGGMVTTCDEEIANRIRMMSLHGISRDAWKRFSAEGSWYYEIFAPGYKFNMTDIQAAIGIQQLSRADELREARAEIARQYDEAFRAIPEIGIPETELNVSHAWHLYVIQIDNHALRCDRNTFITALNEAGVGTSVHYTPLHLHPLYRRMFGYRPEDLPNATAAYERIISLPLFPGMEPREVSHVIGAVERTVARYRR